MIKNPELKKQISSSAIFASLPEKERAAHLEKMAKLPPKQQEEFAGFFEAENLKAAATQDQALLMDFFKELEDLKRKFIRLAREDKEKVLGISEKTEQQDLLNQLNQL